MDDTLIRTIQVLTSKCTFLIDNMKEKSRNIYDANTENRDRARQICTQFANRRHRERNAVMSAVFVLRTFLRLPEVASS